MEIGNINFCSCVIDIMPSHAFFVRITAPYKGEVERVVLAWSMRADTLACYEHSGSKTGKIHCHITLTGCDVDKKQLRNIAAAQGINVKGNENCSFKAYDGDAHANVYMTKGNLLPKYLKGFTNSDAEHWCKSWKPLEETAHQDAWDNLYNGMKNEFEYNEKEWPSVYDPGPEGIGRVINFYRLRDHVKRYVASKCGGFHRPQAFNSYKCMMRGIIYEWRVTVPKGENSFW